MKLYLSSVLEHCEKRVLEGKPLDAVWDFPNLNILLRNYLLNLSH